MIVAGAKPTNTDVIRYYRRVAEHYRLSTCLYEAATDIARERDDTLTVATSRGRSLRARAVVVATGFFDYPNRLGVPGEDLDKVSHYYDGPLPYYDQRVAVVGAGNSAMEAVLEIYRAGAKRVSLVYRGSGIKAKTKYWLKPDIENRIREGSIDAHFGTEVRAIGPEQLFLSKGGEDFAIDNDFVLALTGYHTDFEFLRRIGIDLDVKTMEPTYNEATMESPVRGVYLAGVVCCGLDTGQIFIENCRVHAERIADSVAAKT